MIRFENSHFLLLLIPLFVCYGFLLFKIHRIAQNFCAFQNEPLMIQAIKTRNFLFLLAAIFLILAISIPLWGSKKVARKRNGVSVMIVMDVSRSMTINDIPPNRLRFAKSFAEGIIEKLNNTACGLVISKGNGVLAVPLTFSRRGLITALEDINPKCMSSVGSNLEQGLLSAIKAFPKNNVASKVILLYTDGGETRGSLKKTIQKALQEGITIIIVGVGTEQGGKLPIINEAGKKVLITLTLDEKKLQQATNYRNAFYIRATAQGSALAVLKAIDLEGAESQKIITIHKPVPRLFECAFFSFICICTGFILQGLIWKRKEQ